MCITGRPNSIDLEPESFASLKIEEALLWLSLYSLLAFFMSMTSVYKIKVLDHLYTNRLRAVVLREKRHVHGENH